MSINDSWSKVRDFHLAFGHPTSDKPRMLSPERAAPRRDWMQEELDEFRDSVSLEEQADAMIDLIYFALGTLVEMGVKPESVFDIVHDANMSKLWPDGKAHFAPDGKVIKPETWVDPEPLFKQALLSQR